MNLNDLLIQRTETIERMQTIIDGASEAKRSLSDEEKTQWESMNSEVTRMASEIETIQKQEELTRSLLNTTTTEELKPNNNQTKKSMKTLEAVRALASRKELPAEVVELQRSLADGIATDGIMIERAHTYANGTGSIPSSVEGLNVIGNKSIIDQLGATMYTGLSGEIKKLPFMDSVVGAAKAEGAAFDSDATTKSSVTLEPQRVGVSFVVSKEALATYNESTWNGILQNYMDAADRKLTGMVYDKVLAGATAVAAATTVTKANMDLLEKTVDADGSYLMSRTQFFAGKDVKVDAGSGKFLFNKVSNEYGVNYEGTPIHYSNLFAAPATEDYIVFGHMPNVAIGIWGQGYEIIANPYTGAKSGEVEITVNRICDVEVVNAAKAFAKTADLVA